MSQMQMLGIPQDQSFSLAPTYDGTAAKLPKIHDLVKVHFFNTHCMMSYATESIFEYLHVSMI